MQVIISKGVITITTKEDVIMATLSEVQASIADLQATGQAVEDGLDRVLVAMQALRDQVASGGGAASASDLDALMAQLVTAKTPLSDSLAKEVLP